MANHRIEINPFDPSSVNAAQREYQRIIDDFNNKVHQFVLRIAQLVESVLKANYGSAVTVTMSPLQDGYNISANGRAVVFLEFGAGLMTDSSDRYASIMPFPVYEGSYSENVGSGEYYATGKWHFGGREYQYVVPTNACQKAYEAVMQQYVRIAREVFG